MAECESPATSGWAFVSFASYSLTSTPPDPVRLGTCDGAPGAVRSTKLVGTENHRSVALQISLTSWRRNTRFAALLSSRTQLAAAYDLLEERPCFTCSALQTTRSVALQFSLTQPRTGSAKVSDSVTGLLSEPPSAPRRIVPVKIRRGAVCTKRRPELSGTKNHPQLLVCSSSHFASLRSA